MTNFAILVPAPELSLSDAKNNPFRKMRDTLYRERQLWSGNEIVEIRYVSGSSVAGTSASSPGVPRQILYSWLYVVRNKVPISLLKSGQILYMARKKKGGLGRFPMAVCENREKRSGIGILYFSFSNPLWHPIGGGEDTAFLSFSPPPYFLKQSLGDYIHILFRQN